jgi:NRPS condensation-like uncharacterized protein
MTVITPLTPVEEAVYHLEQHTESWNVQIELAADERLDADRLRDAAEAAGAHHPMARARLERHGGLDSELRWRIPDGVEDLRFSSSAADDAEELRALRATFYDDGFAPTEDLPYRVRHVEGPDRDRVMLSVCHVPCDGIGALRLATTLTSAYRGDPLPEDPVDLATARRALDDARPDGVGDRLRQLVTAADHLRNTVDDPDRIAGTGGEDAAGDWGFVHATRGVPDELDVGARPGGVSVNDVLLAGFHRAIARWNEDRGAPADKISLMMPVNLRPRDWFYAVVGIYALFDRVATTAADRGTGAAMLDAVADQTRAIKREDRAVSLLESMHLIPSATPVDLRGRLTDFLRGPGEGLMDTAVLSNLGRAPEPLPAFAGDAPDGLWFSPPCRGPTAVGLGAVTADDALSLSLRYRTSHLDHAGAERLLASTVDEVRALLDGD